MRLMFTFGLMVPLLAQSPALRSELDRYLTRLGNGLAKRAKGQPFPYSFALFDDRRAAALPLAGIPAFPFHAEQGELGEALAVTGGAVFVPLRLMSAVESEAELAAVLAHAIAHISLRHPARIENQARPDVPEADLLVRARNLELEADELALRMLAEAGYDPAGLVTFLRKAPRGQTHPSPEARIKVIEQTLQSLPRRAYKASTGQFEKIKALISRLPFTSSAPPPR